MEELEELSSYLRRFVDFSSIAIHRRPRWWYILDLSSRDGYIVTNHHVVDGADTVVSFSDRREFDAEVIGTDQRSDLALLRVDANELPFCVWVLRELEGGTMGSSDWLAVWPRLLGDGRHCQCQRPKFANGKGENYVPFIQTDVAINPGNSGGPLFNLARGCRVNSQIFTRSGGSIGLSFAIPARCP